MPGLYCTNKLPSWMYPLNWPHHQYCKLKICCIFVFLKDQFSMLCCDNATWSGKETIMLWLKILHFVATNMAEKFPNGSLKISNAFTLTNVQTQTWTANILTPKQHDHCIPAVEIQLQLVRLQQENYPVRVSNTLWFLCCLCKLEMYQLKLCYICDIT